MSQLGDAEFVISAVRAIWQQRYEFLLVVLLCVIWPFYMINRIIKKLRKEEASSPVRKPVIRTIPPDCLRSTMPRVKTQ
jgi:hypothetical protein